MPDAALAIQENQNHSVRELAPGSGMYGGLVGDGFGILWGGTSGLLPPWGTYACDRELRAYHYFLHNQLWSGAHDIWQQKVLSTPFEISGGRNLTFKWQDIFMESEFGQGYDELMSMSITDYLTLNRGFFLELVSLGDPDTPLKEDARIIGINHLDALRIVFTGNLEYPFIYYSEWTGTPHRMHRTRVVHMTHSPTPDTRMFGMGRSPLYAALSTVNTQILLGRHQNEMLNDLPPPGLIIFQNIKGEDVQDAMLMFEAERRKEGQGVYRAPMRLEGKDPAQPVTVTFTPLAQVPEGFDRQKYMEVDVNLIALNMQLDPQDIWPLSGGGLGNGQQSKELAAKTEIKGPGYFLTRMERVWNRITPRPLEFKYKAQNADQDLNTANIAQIWTNVINSASFADAMEKRQLAANQIPAFADVLMDEQGNVRLPDDDPKVETQVIMVDPGQMVDPNAQQLPPGAQPDTTANDAQQNAPPPDGEPAMADDTAQIGKEYDATKSAFTDDVAAILQDAADGGVSKASFSARMRSSINTYGNNAYKDGLESGGVDPADYDSEDSDTFAALLASQSGYVTDIANRLYKEDGTLIANADYNASLWANKTLTPFYQAGLVSADKNGLYEWQYGDTEHCATCLAMNGQKHRMKDYVSKGILPQSDYLDCGGFNCQCSLVKTTGKAKGSWA